MRQSLFKKMAYAHIGLSLISLLSVALWAWIDPDRVMALVQVNLTNTDSLSSIRGAYDGAGVMLVILFLYLTPFIPYYYQKKVFRISTEK